MNPPKPPKESPGASSPGQVTFVSLFQAKEKKICKNVGFQNSFRLASNLILEKMVVRVVSEPKL